jgi:hypothetical protein
MNTGQMLLTIAAFMLLGVVMINFRSADFQNEDVLDGNEYAQKAVAIGRSLIEEMQEKVFDQQLVSKKIIRVENLSACGPAYTEKYPDFHDVDDFHGSVFRSPASGVTPTSTTPKCLWDTWGYTVSIRVEFVSPTNPTIVSAIRTFAKRATLRISNQFTDEVVTMSFIAAY